MKKVLLAALVGVAGYLGYKKMQAAKDEQDLWAEATDPVASPEPATNSSTPPGSTAEPVPPTSMDSTGAS
jgi:hypothetical protein